MNMKNSLFFNSMFYQVINHFLIAVAFGIVVFLRKDWLLAVSIIFFIAFINLINFLLYRKISKIKKDFYNLDPKNVHLIIDNKEKDIPIEQAKPGDIIFIKEGERVPLDGIVFEGEVLVNESFLFKDARSTFKRANDHIYAASVNEGEPFKIRVAKKQGENLLDKVLDLKERSQIFQMPIQKITNGFAIGFVFLMAAASFWVYYYVGDLNKTITIFLIASAGQAAFLAKSAVSYIVYYLAASGVAISKQEIFQKIASIDVLVLDKTNSLNYSQKNIFP